MKMTLLLPSVFIGIICNGAVASTSLSAVGGGANEPDNAQAPYPRYPACRRGREFAIQAQDNERVEGRRYFERQRPDGRMRYYFCSPCTVCEETGLIPASPCIERSDTACSKDCIVPGCVFDVSGDTCVPSSGSDLPVDPETLRNDGQSVCHAPVTSDGSVVKNYKSMLPDKGSTAVNIIVSENPQVHNINQATNGERVLPSAQSTRRPNTPQMQGFTWTASEALFGGIAIVSAVVIANVFAILYIRNKNREAAKRKRAVESTDSLHAVMARARSDSNVDGKNKDVVCV